MGGFYYAIYFLYSAVATVDHFKINSAKIMFFFFTDQLLLSFLCENFCWLLRQNCLLSLRLMKSSPSRSGLQCSSCLSLAKYLELQVGALSWVHRAVILALGKEKKMVLSESETGILYRDLG